MIEFETEVLDIIQRTPSVKSFRFKASQDIDFKAGQFFVVSIKIGETQKSKHFSFSNSPSEKGYIEFTKKITESEFSQALDKLRIGEWARLKLPYGSFVLDDRYKKIAFLCGGIGITPVRSMVKYIIDKGLDTDIVFIYGNRRIEDIAFRDDFDSMQKEYSKLKVVHILSQAEAGWTGMVGYINGQVIKQEIPDYTQRRFYTSGPPAMVGAMKQILEDELKLAKEGIIRENFTGY
jgi:ferredoxin-NADP reductase